MGGKLKANCETERFLQKRVAISRIKTLPLIKTTMQYKTNGLVLKTDILLHNRNSTK